MSVEDALQERIQARRTLTYHAWNAFNNRVTAEQWIDTAPQWALDITSQNEINHLISYIWSQSDSNRH